MFSMRCAKSNGCDKVFQFNRKIGRASLEPGNRARVEAWLRYGNDLGLGPYYRDRVVSRAAACRRVRMPASESTEPSHHAMAAAAGQRDADSSVRAFAADAQIFP